ncbi:MAG: hypothetical protein LBQ47_05765, partial [Endomicrobium sp.]|nr:hypothetical protein [Endomicrobium sp.]
MGAFKVKGGADANLLYTRSNLYYTRRSAMESIAHELGHNYLFLFNFSNYFTETDKTMHEFVAYLSESLPSLIFGEKFNEFEKFHTSFDIFEENDNAEAEVQEAHDAARGVLNHIFSSVSKELKRKLGFPLDSKLIAKAAISFASGDKFNGLDSQSAMFRKFIEHFAQIASQELGINKESIIEIFKNANKTPKEVITQKYIDDSYNIIIDNWQEIKSCILEQEKDTDLNVDFDYNDIKVKGETVTFKLFNKNSKKQYSYFVEIDLKTKHILTINVVDHTGKSEVKIDFSNLIEKIISLRKAFKNAGLYDAETEYKLIEFALNAPDDISSFSKKYIEVLKEIIIGRSYLPARLQKEPRQTSDFIKLHAPAGIFQHPSVTIEKIIVLREAFKDAGLGKINIDYDLIKFVSEEDLTPQQIITITRQIAGFVRTLTDNSLNINNKLISVFSKMDISIDRQNLIIKNINDINAVFEKAGLEKLPIDALLLVLAARTELSDIKSFSAQELKLLREISAQDIDVNTLIEFSSNIKNIVDKIIILRQKVNKVDDKLVKFALKTKLTTKQISELEKEELETLIGLDNDLTNNLVVLKERLKAEGFGELRIEKELVDFYSSAQLKPEQITELLATQSEILKQAMLDFSIYPADFFAMSKLEILAMRKKYDVLLHSLNNVIKDNPLSNYNVNSLAKLRKMLIENAPMINDIKVSDYQSIISIIDMQIARGMNLLSDVEKNALFSERELEYLNIEAAAVNRNNDSLKNVVKDTTINIKLRLFAFMHLNLNKADFNDENALLKLIDEFQKEAKADSVKIADNYDLRAVSTGVHLLLSSYLKEGNPKFNILYSDKTIYSTISKSVIVNSWEGDGAGEFQVKLGANSYLQYARHMSGIETIAHELGHNYLYLFNFYSSFSQTEKTIHEFVAYLSESLPSLIFGKKFDKFEKFNKSFDIFKENSKAKVQESHDAAMGVLNYILSSVSKEWKQKLWLPLDSKILIDVAISFAIGDEFNGSDSQSVMFRKFIEYFAQTAWQELEIDKESIIKIFEDAEKGVASKEITNKSSKKKLELPKNAKIADERGYTGAKRAFYFAVTEPIDALLPNFVSKHYGRDGPTQEDKQTDAYKSRVKGNIAIKLMSAIGFALGFTIPASLPIIAAAAIALSFTLNIITHATYNMLVNEDSRLEIKTDGARKDSQKNIEDEIKKRLRSIFNNVRVSVIFLATEIWFVSNYSNLENLFPDILEFIENNKEIAKDLFDGTMYITEDHLAKIFKTKDKAEEVFNKLRFLKEKMNKSNYIYKAIDFAVSDVSIEFIENNKDISNALLNGIDIDAGHLAKIFETPDKAKKVFDKLNFLKEKEIEIYSKAVEFALSDVSVEFVEDNKAIARVLFNNLGITSEQIAKTFETTDKAKEVFNKLRFLQSNEIKINRTAVEFAISDISVEFVNDNKDIAKEFFDSNVISDEIFETADKTKEKFNKLRFLKANGIKINEAAAVFAISALSDIKENLELIENNKEIAKEFFANRAIMSLKDLETIFQTPNGAKEVFNKFRFLKDNGIEIDGVAIRFAISDVNVKFIESNKDVARELFGKDDISSYYLEMIFQTQDQAERAFDKLRFFLKNEIPITDNTIDFVLSAASDNKKNLEIINNNKDVAKEIFDTLGIPKDVVKVFETPGKAEEIFGKLKFLKDNGIKICKTAIYFALSKISDVDKNMKIIINNKEASNDVFQTLNIFSDKLEKIFNTPKQAEKAFEKLSLFKENGIVITERAVDFAFTGIETEKIKKALKIEGSIDLIKAMLSDNEFSNTGELLPIEQIIEFFENPEAFKGAAYAANGINDIFAGTPKNVIDRIMKGERSFREDVINVENAQEHNINDISNSGDLIKNLQALNEVLNIENITKKKQINDIEKIKKQLNDSIKQRTNYTLEELLKDKDKVKLFYDEIVYALVDIRKEITVVREGERSKAQKELLKLLEESLNKYSYVKGEGIEFKLSGRNLENYNIGYLTGDCTGDLAEGTNRENYRSRWLMDKDYEVVEVFINGDFVARFDYIGGTADGEKAIFIHAQEDIPGFRDGTSSHKAQRETAYYKAIEFIIGFAGRNGYKDVYINSVSNSNLIKEKSDSISSGNINKTAKKLQYSDIRLQEDHSWRLVDKQKVQEKIEEEKRNTPLKQKRLNKEQIIKKIIKNGFFEGLYIIGKNKYAIKISDNIVMIFYIKGNKPVWELVNSGDVSLEAVNFQKFSDFKENETDSKEEAENKKKVRDIFGNALKSENSNEENLDKLEQITLNFKDSIGDGKD